MPERRPSQRYVLDSFALLSYLGDEAGADRVGTILADSRAGRAEVWLSVINFGEALYITERERSLAAARSVVAVVDEWPIRVVDADRACAFAAAHLKAHHRMSYADAFAAALAQDKDATLVTGDPEFRQLEPAVRIEWLLR